MGIEAIGTGIKVLLNTIAGLRVYASNEVPDSLELPCALILAGTSDYATAYDLSFDLTYRIVVCISKQDTPSAFNKILDYIDTAGAKSIWLKLDADRTLNASAHTSKLLRNLGIGYTTWGAIVYLSTEFELAVWSK
jgi:hypothetical protein